MNKKTLSVCKVFETFVYKTKELKIEKNTYYVHKKC